MPSLLVITGPTAAGKTEQALRLAELWHVPIINADSRQIYRDLPIGTAAPTAEEQARVPHFLVGTHTLDRSYNAGMFERDALNLINSLLSERPRAVTEPMSRHYRTIIGPLSGQYRGNIGSISDDTQGMNEVLSGFYRDLKDVIAIVCGGSMLYIDALCNGLDDIPEVPADIRAELNEQYRTNGLVWLQEQVRRLDPDYWQVVDRLNPQRLLHCLELCRVTGGTYSSLRKQTKQQRPFDIILHVVSRPRDELYERINARVTKMVDAGLIDEADRAFRLTLGDAYRAMTYTQAFNLLPNSLRTVGYQELLPYFLGTTPLENALNLIRQNTRHYAKRQLTWWRNRQNATGKSKAE